MRRRILNQYVFYSRSVCWAPDSSFFATASRDHTVKIWKWHGDLGKFELEFTLPRFTAGATAVAMEKRLV